MQEEDGVMAEGGGADDTTAKGDKTAQGPKGHEWIGNYVQVRTLSLPTHHTHMKAIVA